MASTAQVFAADVPSCTQVGNEMCGHDVHNNSTFASAVMEGAAVDKHDVNKAGGAYRVVGDGGAGWQGAWRCRVRRRDCAAADIALHIVLRAEDIRAVLAGARGCDALRVVRRPSSLRVTLWGWHADVWRHRQIRHVAGRDPARRRPVSPWRTHTYPSDALLSCTRGHSCQCELSGPRPTRPASTSQGRRETAVLCCAA